MTAKLETELVDAKITLSEARTDTKFAEMNGRLDLLMAAVQSADQRQADRAASLEAAVSDRLSSLGSRLSERSMFLETRISELRAETIEGNRGNRTTSIAVGIGVAGIVIATVALLPSVFGIGMQVRDVVRQEISATPATPAVAPSAAIPTSTQLTSPPALPQTATPRSVEPETKPAGSTSTSEPAPSK